jgi:PAS domain S-box-containing protein
MSRIFRVLPKTTPEDARVALAALRSAGHWLVDWDPVTDSLRWVTAPAAQLLGHPTQALATRADLLALAHPDDLLAVGLANEALQKSDQESAAAEFRLRDAQGQWRWLESRSTRLNDAASRRERFVSVLLDITDRKRAEGQLAIGALVLESIFDAVIMTDSSGRIRWANSAAAELLEVPIAELSDLRLDDFSADSRERQIELSQDIRDGVSRAGLWRGRISTRSANGAAVPTDASVTRVAGDDGELWLHVRRDLRDDIQQQAAVIESSQRDQKHLGQLLHEALGQELAAASLMLQSLKSGQSTAQLLQIDAIERILSESVRRCQQLANGMTPYAVAQHGLVAALQDLARRVEGQGAARVTVSVAQAAAEVTGNSAVLLHRAAATCVEAAVARAADAHIDIRVWQDRDRIVLTVSDDVPWGVDAETSPIDRGMQACADVQGATIETVALGARGRRLVMQIPERYVETTIRSRALRA